MPEEQKEHYAFEPLLFAGTVERLLRQAKEQKNREPKSELTRHWAVVYTELEKLLAYTRTYLKE